MCLYIYNLSKYIYIYIERERERKKEKNLLLFKDVEDIS